LADRGVDEEEAMQMQMQPRAVPVPPSLVLERIKMVACSPRHTLVLSFLGTVYACGENTEGALGTGDVLSR
jgi:alpha-tubulin suppressor-like RCC1 family protein